MERHIDLGLLALLLLFVACGNGKPPDDLTEHDSLGVELGPISRRIASSNAATDRTMNLVARIEVQPNEMVDFYEPEPGQVLISGAGAPEGPPIAEGMLTDNSDVTAYWSALTHDAPMPSELAAAVAQRSPRLVATEALPVDVQSEIPEQDLSYEGSASHDPHGGPARSAHLTADWCDSTYYSTFDPNYGLWTNEFLGDCDSWWDFTVCWNHVTGDGTALADDYNHHASNVCPYRGDVTYKAYRNSNTVPWGTWNVPQNSYRWTRHHPGCSCFLCDCPYYIGRIRDAAGDGYQFRFMAKDP